MVTLPFVGPERFYTPLGAVALVQGASVRRDLNEIRRT